MENKTGKLQQDRLLTAIVGSYPKPADMYAGSGRELLNLDGAPIYALEQEIGTREFTERANQACLEAIADQNLAGIDLMTDGEERRGHYVYYILRRLGGIDFERLTEKTIRNGAYLRRVPTIVGKLSYQQPIVVADYTFTRKYAGGIPKIGLPGPSTVVDGVADDYYHGNQERLAMDSANAIRHEGEKLIEVGCRAIQFDDPVLLRYPDKAKAWGLTALQACFEGFEDQATFIVHICRGYPDKPLEHKGIVYKASTDYYQDILTWLSESTIDVVSIEGAQSNLDLPVLPAIGQKTVMLGVLDVGSNDVESTEQLVERGREAVRYIPARQLILAPDCGMVQLSREAARQKLVNLARAAARLNGMLAVAADNQIVNQT